MSAIAPEAFELAKVVVIGRLTGCCGPLANEVAARRTGKKLRSFMVFTSFQNVLRHGTKIKPPPAASPIYSLRFFLRSTGGVLQWQLRKRYRNFRNHTILCCHDMVS